MWPKSVFSPLFFSSPWEISLYSHHVRRVLMFHSRYAAEQSHRCLWTFLTQRLDLMTRRDGHMGRHEGVICHGSELLSSTLMNSSAFVWHSSAHVCRDSQRASFCWCHASPTPKSFYSSWDTDNICLQNIKKKVPEKARRHSTFSSFLLPVFVYFHLAHKQRERFQVLEWVSTFSWTSWEKTEKHVRIKTETLSANLPPTCVRGYLTVQISCELIVQILTKWFNMGLGRNLV